MINKVYTNIYMKIYDEDTNEEIEEVLISSYYLEIKEDMNFIFSGRPPKVGEPSHLSLQRPVHLEKYIKEKNAPAVIKEFVSTIARAGFVHLKKLL